MTEEKTLCMSKKHIQSLERRIFTNARREFLKRYQTECLTSPGLELLAMVHRVYPKYTEEQIYGKFYAMEFYKNQGYLLSEASKKDGVSIETYAHWSLLIVGSGSPISCLEDNRIIDEINYKNNRVFEKLGPGDSFEYAIYQSYSRPIEYIHRLNPRSCLNYGTVCAFCAWD